MFTLDTESGFRDVVFITGTYGLGENLVQGNVDPDEFYVHKRTLRQGYRVVLSRSLGRKQIRMVYGRGNAARTRNVHTSQAERARFCIKEAEVLKLAEYGIRIEEHYSKQAAHPMPMDIEWAKDGHDACSTLSRRDPRRSPPAKRPEHSRPLLFKVAVEFWSAAVPSERRSPPAVHA